MGKKKTAGILFLVFGIVILISSLIVDAIGLGSYPGFGNSQLVGVVLGVLMIEPQQMSSSDLYAYLNFLQENKLNAGAEKLIFWQKLFSPLAVIVMCLLAFPFVLGVQRQGNTGQRLLIGILLGLAFVVADNLVTQLAVQFGVNPILVALLPSLIFLVVAIYLLARRQSHGPGG